MNFTLNLCILAVLMIPGVALFIMETFPPETGGVIFRKYDATKLYWLGLIAYSVISKQVHKKVDRQRPPIPRAPLSKQLIFKESGKPIEQENQTAIVKSGN